MQLPPLCRLGLLAAAAALAGCVVPMTSSNTYLVPLGNGETMTMSYNSRGPILENVEGIQIIQADLLPTLDKKHIHYVFEFSVKSGMAVRDVRIQDMTAEPVEELAHDEHPQLAKDHWILTTPFLDPKEHGLEWIIQLDETIRVFRFTVTLADGTKVVINQPKIYPVVIKQMIRKMLGIE